MATTCLNLITKLNNAIDKANWYLINEMTNPNMKYLWVCIKPSVTYQTYFENLKQDWDDIINDFINDPNKCGVSTDTVSSLISTYQNIDPKRLYQLKKILAATSDISSNKIDIDGLIFETIYSSVLKNQEPVHFDLSENAFQSTRQLAKIIADNCQCQLTNIFRTIIKNYKRKYQEKYIGKTKNEMIDLFRSDYANVKRWLQQINNKDTVPLRISNNLTNLYSFSIENELDTLIPSELGSLKDFFIKVITRYYDNLHPIIWAQIFKQMTENVFVELPFTQEEIFSFVSKYVLLNSGPFILKTLQMIRPVLSPELAQKYNLTKLTYPKLTPHQIDLILQKSVYEWDMYNILENYSASVGHVSKVVRADNPDKPIIIKIIKPIAIAQSCWEYKTLYDAFPVGTCENDFIQKILESNGKELNIQNEIININRGYEYYTDTYQNVFGKNVVATLTTVQHIPGIVEPNCWFVMAMTLAPGIPISKLVEEDLLEFDTKYRAKLHRCLDILVYKFFITIINHGYYHGDPHAGNIYFSYENDQMTLIDFGAVGEINIFSGDSDTLRLLDIIIMSIFYNYDGILDEMTDLLNSKCTETQIDKNTSTYQDLKQELLEYRIINILNEDQNQQLVEKYSQEIFSESRISEEQHGEMKIEQPLFNPSDVKSIYSYLRYGPWPKETVIENRDVLPKQFEKINDTNNITFAGILEKIIKFYAVSGVNIAIKFNEFYEFQKAYALLLGVLHKTKYDSYRTGIVTKQAIVNLSNATNIIHLETSTHIVQKYLAEKKTYDGFKKKILIDVN